LAMLFEGGAGNLQIRTCKLDQEVSLPKTSMRYLKPLPVGIRAWLAGGKFEGGVQSPEQDIDIKVPSLPFAQTAVANFIFEGADTLVQSRWLVVGADVSDKVEVITLSCHRVQG